MLAAGIFLLVLLIAAGAIAGYRLVAPRRERSADWTAAAGEEFMQLSEAERCDLIFAFAALEDSRSERLLEDALEDPSETVAIAAARAMANRGRTAALERYLARATERTRRIAQMLELFT